MRMFQLMLLLALILTATPAHAAVADLAAPAEVFVSLADGSIFRGIFSWETGEGEVVCRGGKVKVGFEYLTDDGGRGHRVRLLDPAFRAFRKAHLAWIKGTDNLFLLELDPSKQEAQEAAFKKLCQPAQPKKAHASKKIARAH